jgi:hypothetical protein
MTKDELFEVIETNFNTLAENNAGTTKAAGEIKKLSTDYRKASVAESK